MLCTLLQNICKNVNLICFSCKINAVHLVFFQCFSWLVEPTQNFKLIATPQIRRTDLYYLPPPLISFCTFLPYACTPSASLQLAAKEGRKKESIQEARFDYYNMDRDDDDYDEVDLREDELSHIIEIYDFPTEFKTEDLVKLFQCYQYVKFTTT